MKNLLFIFGTRPEAIKLAPVMLEFKKYPQKYNVILCNTEQQKELSHQALNFFGLKADINLGVMVENQSLSSLQARILVKLEEVFKNHKIDGVFIQGDTMSVFAGALTSFYHKAAIFHIEAGLRSYDLFEPFPEEAIRQMVSRITTLHFAPTKKSAKSLKKEGISKDKIYQVGNTGIDALSLLNKKALQSASKFWKSKNVNVIRGGIVLVTAHRRENHGQRLEYILDSIEVLSSKFPSHQFILPLHPNPNVKNRVCQRLSIHQNIILTEALDYPQLVYILQKAKLVLTDSGGIQEEAPTFGVPILILRHRTERMEGVKKGFAKLVGTKSSEIIKEATKVLSQGYTIDGVNPYGDGKASQKIEKIIRRFLNG